MQWMDDSSSLVSVGSFSGHTQQANAEMAELIGETFGSVFTVWCDEATDVEAGDTLSVASGDYAGSYTVKNKKVNSVGNNKHIALTVIRDEL